MSKLTINVLPDSSMADAIVACYSYKKIYLHQGKQYQVEELKPVGSGNSARLQATLNPVSSSWEQMEKSYESIFGLSRDGDAF